MLPSLIPVHHYRAKNTTVSQIPVKQAMEENVSQIPELLREIQDRSWKVF